MANYDWRKLMNLVEGLQYDDDKRPVKGRVAADRIDPNSRVAEDEALTEELPDFELYEEDPEEVEEEEEDEDDWLDEQKIAEIAWSQEQRAQPSTPSAPTPARPATPSRPMMPRRRFRP